MLCDDLLGRMADLNSIIATCIQVKVPTTKTNRTVACPCATANKLSIACRVRPFHTADSNIQ